MNGSAVRYWLILACLLATIYGSFAVWRQQQGDVDASHSPPPLSTARTGPPLTDFVLTDQSDARFDSRSLQGKVWVGSFFFTNCPGSCWRLNQALAALQETEPGQQARIISITCDPDNDTPAALTKYAEQFHANLARWTFLTGDFQLIRRIGNDFFQVAVEKGTHTDRAFVVDRKGQVRGRFRLTDPDQVKKLEKLLALVEAEAPESSESGEQPPATAASGS